MNKALLVIKYSTIALFAFCFSSKAISQWQEVYYLDNMVGLCLASNENNHVYFGTWFAGINRSTDYGSTWGWTNFPPGNSVRTITSNGSIMFAGATNTGVYISGDDGMSWTPVNNGITDPHMGTLLSYNNVTFAGNLSGVFLTTNNGSNWIPRDSGLTNLTIHFFANNGNMIYTGTAGGLFVSTNNGVFWTPINNGFTSISITALVFVGTYMFAGTWTGGVFLSTNGGSLWQERSTGMTHRTVTAMAASGNNLFALTDTGGVYFSSNYGESWALKNEGLSPGLYTYSLLILNNYIFLGQNPGVWRRALSEITGISSNNNQLPQKFALYQNYPNPFNPSTKISYDLPTQVNVKLFIYDVLGREVKTLVNEKQNAGNHEIEFDASNYPSGVYYYKLSTDNFSETKKMVLIK